MKYVLIGTLLGSLVTSEHDTKEACEGRAVTLREAKVAASCVPAPTNYSTSITTGTVLTCCTGAMCPCLR